MFGTSTNDFSIAVASFFLKATGIWTSNNRVEKWFRNVATIYTIFMMLLSIFVQSTEFFRGKLDSADLLYSFANVLSTSSDLFKMFVLITHKKDFLSLVVHLRRQFLESHYDTNERTILDACRSTCAIFIGFYTIFSHMTILGYVLGPLLVSIGKNESERIFPFHLPAVPFYVTPYFEIIFFVQTLLVYTGGLCHFCFDNILCIMNLHVATQFRILQYRLSNLKVDDVLDNSAMQMSNVSEKSYIAFRRYVQQHKVLIAYCKKLEDVFNLIVFAQIFVLSILICFSGLQILMTTTVAGRRYTFMFFFITSFVQLLMFTYSCDGLIRESLNIAPAVYSSSWTSLPMNEYGKMFRKDAVLVIMRSRIPCCLTAKKFFPVSLETYTKVWSTTLSYFTLLREMMDDL